MLDLNISKGTKVIIYGVLIILGLLLIVPFVYMISISLASPGSNAREQFTIFPREFYFSNFKNLFSNTSSAPVGKWLMNSFFVVALSIIGQVFSCVFVAFGFAKIQYKHKNKFFIVLMSTMMLPTQITLIPVFLIFRNIGLYNTLWPLIIPQFFGSAYNIFLVRQFMTSIPGSLFEAADLDGLSYFGMFRHIVLPLVKPAMWAIGIFTFNFTWGDIMTPLIYISDVEKMPMALGAQLLSASSNPSGSVNMSILMCMSLLLTIPQLLIYIFGQKYLFQMNLGLGNDGTK